MVYSCIDIYRAHREFPTGSLRLVEKRANLSETMDMCEIAENLNMSSRAQTEMDGNCTNKLMTQTTQLRLLFLFPTAGVNHVLELSTQRTGDWPPRVSALIKLKGFEWRSIKAWIT